MDVTIFPGLLKGHLEAIPSKSYSHRIMIAEALACLNGGEPVFEEDRGPKDIAATRRCVDELTRAARRGGEAVFDCGESGSTLRFMLPVAAALGVPSRFYGSGRLPERPIDELLSALEEHGIDHERNDRGNGPDGSVHIVSIKGAMSGGHFKISKHASSQYISGILMALPLTREGGSVSVASTPSSAPYIDITLDVLKKFGIAARSEKSSYGGGIKFTVPSGSVYKQAGMTRAEGDWSNAAFWLAADFLGADIGVGGLDTASPQGDRAILDVLAGIRDTAVIDADSIPDLVPIISVIMAQLPGTRSVVNAGRLRSKESDRLAAVTENLGALGVDIKARHDGITVTGGRGIGGGTVSGHGDHRIVMATAIAAMAARAPVTILGAEAVAKSYPRFFTDYRRLGGNIEVRESAERKDRINE